jgi:cytochrome c-type biogenesis protein CcmH/NrfF
MLKWSSSTALALALIVGSAAEAQMASKNQKVDVLRVGSRLACQCGGCSDTVATCSMYGCWSHSAKEKIAKMQSAGVSDSGIIDDFVKAYGKGIYRGAPNTFGWLVPYLILALGAAAVIMFVRHARRRPKPALVMDPRLAQYNEQIDKELQNLDR